MIVGVLAALIVAILPARSALADEMTLVSSANPSAVGQKVTFTAVFPLTCANGASVTFTVDGKSFGPDTYDNRTGIKVTVTLSRVFQTRGDHVVVARYNAGVAPDPICSDSHRLTQKVKPQLQPRPSKPPANAPSPAPITSPKPTSPAPPAAHSPSPSPSSSASGPRLNFAADQVGPTGIDVVPVGTLAVLLAVLLAVSYLLVRRQR